MKNALFDPVTLTFQPQTIQLLGYPNVIPISTLLAPDKQKDRQTDKQTDSNVLPTPTDRLQPSAVGQPTRPTQPFILTGSTAGAITVHSFVVPSDELYAVKAGVVCLRVKLCDPHLSALEVRFSRRGAIQIYLYLTFSFTIYAQVLMKALLIYYSH